MSNCTTLLSGCWSPLCVAQSPQTRICAPCMCTSHGVHTASINAHGKTIQTEIDTRMPSMTHEQKIVCSIDGIGVAINGRITSAFCERNLCRIYRRDRELGHWNPKLVSYSHFCVVNQQVQVTPHCLVLIALSKNTTTHLKRVHDEWWKKKKENNAGWFCNESWDKNNFLHFAYFFKQLLVRYWLCPDTVKVRSQYIQ